MNETLKKLIVLLSDGQFHSGERLGKSLGLTRGTIWKLTKQLAEWDLEITSIPNKGYCIPSGLQLLNLKAIQSFLSADTCASIELIEIFDSLPSTNQYLRQSISKQNSKNRVCLAEKQTQGKGRLGREWYSPFAKNIYLSLLWHFSKDLSELSGLSLVIGITIVETLKALKISPDFKIKWPNDILWNYQKIAGILIELSGEANHITNTVIGIGLNVNMPRPPNDPILQPWTYLQRLTEEILDRNKIVGYLLNQLNQNLLLFEQAGFNAFLTRWQALDITFGKPVTITTSTTAMEGTGQGVDAQGNFLLKTPLGKIERLTSGDVSLRLKF